MGRLFAPGTADDLSSSPPELDLFFHILPCVLRGARAFPLCFTRGKKQGMGGSWNLLPGGLPSF